LIADYVLVYRGRKLAVVEAKAWDEPLSLGVGQAKDYAGKLKVRFAYASNGQGVYPIDMETAIEGPAIFINPNGALAFPSPDELWAKTFGAQNAWRDRFAAIPFPDKSRQWTIRFYQEIAVNKVLDCIAGGRDRALLTLATGTGKTSIAFQIAWKLFAARWNLIDWTKKGEPTRRPRILFLADRNGLATQAYNDFTSFAAFNEDDLIRIAPDSIRKKGKVPKNGQVFFTIFQTFMSSASSDQGAGSAQGASAGSDHGDDSESTEKIPTIDEAEIRSAAAYTYILRCGDGSFYTGSTTDLHARLNQHRTGEGAYHTASRPPVTLVYYETFNRISEAVTREKQLKGWTRAKKLALIKGEIELLRALSKSKSASREPVEGRVACPEPVEGYFGEYEPDFFDLIIIDECHRGGANDESTWREILEYFKPAVQLGLTATPKRKDNVDTYRYFGEPLYIYSLKDGINDGFLTPFRVKQYSTTLDEYTYTSDDKVVEGEVEVGKKYEEKDFNKTIRIDERERKRVKLFLEQIDPKEKTIVFCAQQDHALMVRDIINQLKTVPDPNYCQRVTADDGELGDQWLRAFQDNEKTIPTILTTSQKLSTGVDARNVRNIVLLRPVNSIIEFKQIVGRGTRLFEGKDYFTIHDFVKASDRFSDPEWDGEPLKPELCEQCGASPCVCEKPAPELCAVCGQEQCVCPDEPCEECGKRPCVCVKPPRKRVRVKLADGKERDIQHMMATTFWHPDGKPMSAAEFMQALFGRLPEFFKSEEDLRRLWSAPDTRSKLMAGLAEKGFGHEQLAEMQKIISAEKSDLFDVLAHVAYALPPVTREARAEWARPELATRFSDKQRAFLDFVLAQYVKVGVDELAQEKLSPLLKLKYNNAIADAIADLGRPEEIGRAFAGFQKFLYQQAVA